jgi:exodeoxyribonuclease V gamma subunit
LVLEELFDYLTRAYGFDKSKDIRKLPLQPFSEKNYEGNYPSFDARWISDSNPTTNVESEEETRSNQLNELQDIKKEWHLSEWVAFFTHPSKYFAQHRLGLYLEQRVRFPLEDTEPFVLTHLDRYQIQEQTIAATLADLELSQVVKERTLASEFPLNSLVDEQVTQWQTQAMDFTTTLEAFDAKDVENHHTIIPLDNCELTADLPKANNSVLTWRLANPKGKDIVQLWLNHLAANTTSPTTSVGLFRGKDDSIQKLSFDPTENAKSQLDAMFTLVKQGLKEPLFLNADLLLNPLAGKDEEKDFSSAWKDTFRERGFAYDEYIHYFWKQQPCFELTTQNKEAVYAGLFKHVTLAPLEVQE